MENTEFRFTVKLEHTQYVQLLKESRHREGASGAVPTRTARQLIEERLKDINAPILTTADDVQDVGDADELPAPKKGKRSPAIKPAINGNHSTD